MRKKPSKFIFLILIAEVITLDISLVFAEIRINEVEMNPSGDDAGHEWVELYSSSDQNLDGWKLINSRNEIKNLNGNIQSDGFLVINFNEQWLNNENENITLSDANGNLVFIPTLKDTANDNKSWNYCNSNWIQLSSSPGYANNCIYQNNSQNNTQNNSGNQSIYLRLDWNEDDIKNGDEFEIEVKAYNLKAKEYDIKVYISDDDKIISQTLDFNEDNWVSSDYFVENVFTGPGNKTKSLELRIKSNYRSVSGEKTIIARIREKGGSYIAEVEEDIAILEADKEDSEQTSIKNNNEEKTLKEIETITSLETTGNVIHLGGNQKNNKKIVYESVNQKLERYFFYLFFFLIIILFILIIFKRRS